MGIDWKMPLSKVARANAIQHRYGSEFLLAFRVLAVLWAWFVAIRDCLYPRGPYKLYYYTEWTWSIMVVYLTMAVVAYALHRCENRGAEARLPLVSVEAQEAPTDKAQDGMAGTLSGGGTGGGMRQLLSNMSGILAAVLSVNALFVPFCIWGFMFPIAEIHHDVAWLITFSNMNMHIVVLPFVYIDLMCTSLPAFWAQRGFVVITPALYGFFTVGRVALNPHTRHCIANPCDTGVHDTTAPIWPYPFMDTTKAYAPIAYAVLLFMHWALFQAAIRMRIGCARRRARAMMATRDEGPPVTSDISMDTNVAAPSASGISSVEAPSASGMSLDAKVVPEECS